MFIATLRTEDISDYMEKDYDTNKDVEDVEDSKEIQDSLPGSRMTYEVSGDLGEYWDHFHGMVVTPTAKIVISMTT